MQYRVKEVDGADPKIGGAIEKLHRACFPEDWTIPTAHGHWWLAYRGATPVAFAGLWQSEKNPKGGYLCRAGVVKEHRGHGLQKRLIRARIRKARALGFNLLVTDTFENTASANSLIGCGFKLYEPAEGWAHRGALYWRKAL